ncbi:MAG TPA: isocitrate lyase/phosphoenolpyruvate mutase family protein [Hyphomonas sp.]|nr:isocitrate lyase/phosphoenolpyruvate mutase family protein [Hyphomonas sp.]MCB9962199.1 isocitrate lyase/phosphoenolpyruvate mutase family protein [Hyphomonas sp.]HPE49327.1 isocitrate lyase/phosphoenolpyruvate mutase family protein [Hyphomonas sp.]
MTSQKEKAGAFRALHTRPGLFVLPNPWDIGSARMLAGLGFEALATTSAGFAASLGLADYHVTREMKMAHIRALAAATPLPLSADLENGFGHAPEDCAETIRLGAEAGLSGGSIEDYTGEPDKPIYELAEATDRIRAAAEAARALPHDFVLTARAENFIRNIPDLGDTIARLQAYQDAGADVLYAPFLPTMEDIRSVIASVDRPVNVLMGPRAGFVPMAELAELGVKRVSLGSALANVAYRAMIAAGDELLGPGTLGFLNGPGAGANLNALMAKGSA